MNRKKIVILKYSFDALGGAEIVAIKLANELSAYHDIHVVSVSTSNVNSLEGLDDIPFYNIFSKEKRVREIIFTGTKLLRRYLLDNNIDIVISIGLNSNVIVLLSTLFTKIKTINCDHTNIYNNFGNKLYSLQRWLGAKFSTKSIVLTEENKFKYLEKYNLPHHKVDFIYNWVDDIRSLPIQDNIHTKRLLTVGRLSQEKGYDLLKLVAQKVYEKHPDWRWDIYGYGDDNISNELSLVPNIILKGLVSGVENIYPGHSIYIMTSYFEGLPLVLLEAKKFGLPIVSFNCPTGPSEIVKDGINGFLIDNYNVDLMSEKISKLIDSEKIRLEFSSNSSLDLDKFSKERIIQEWLKLIKEM